MPRENYFRTFDRVATPHLRHKQLNFSADDLIAGPTLRPWRYHYTGGVVLDQGVEGACVGFGLAHQLNAGPITMRPQLTSPEARAIYLEAQRFDEWPGEGYSGSSVNGGCLALRAAGRIESFHWAFTLNDVVDAVLRLGPVTMGTDWYTGMMNPDLSGMLRATGQIEGGHAYLLAGANRILRKAKIKNSWGSGWGERGHAWISFDDLERLILQNGEAAIIIERRGLSLPLS